MSRLSSHKTIDRRGKTITPSIIYHASQQLRYMNEGEVLEISIDNFKAIENDIRTWSRMTGHVPPQDKLNQLQEPGAHIYICGGSMQPFGVHKRDLIFDDIIKAEYFTFLEIMDEADTNIYLN